MNIFEQKLNDLTLGSDVVVNGDDGENEWDVYVGGSVFIQI